MCLVLYELLNIPSYEIHGGTQKHLSTVLFLFLNESKSLYLIFNKISDTLVILPVIYVLNTYRLNKIGKAVFLLPPLKLC